MTRPLNMTDAAAEVGLSYERFRKVWPAMHRDQGFPAPFFGRCWDRDAVAAWKTGAGELTGSEPAWKRINALFEEHGVAPPPWRLRDELVAHLLAYERSI